MTVAKITDEDIAAACLIDDVDDACRRLQDIAGITDGGVCGQVFMDLTFEWTTASAAEREEKIREWLAAERSHEGSE